MRLKLTHVGLLVELANHYTTKGALDILSQRIQLVYSKTCILLNGFKYYNITQIVLKDSSGTILPIAPRIKGFIPFPNVLIQK